MHFRSLILSACGLVAAGLSAHSAIIISGNIGEGTGVLEITSEITLTSTQSGAAVALIFDSMGSPSDGAYTELSLSDGIDYSVNGIAGASQGTLVDNMAVDNGSISADDSLIFFETLIFLNNGDAFTIKPGTWSINASADANPAIYGTFDGQAWLIGMDAMPITDPVQVPEPGTYALLAGLASMGVVCWRKRRK